jgi:distribution and morphology protein 31
VRRTAPSTRPTANDDDVAASKPLLDRLPHLPHLHRPTKDELLAAATGFWSRLRIHFKWLSIRSFRPFNMDDISAFFTWILVGHVVWILAGTTAFFSLVIFLVNTVFAQETLARWIGYHLTQSSGVQVVFESAVVPKWKDGVICFKNVFVSRRPGQGKARVSKGSQTSAVAAAAAAAAATAAATDDDDDGNYTQFDVSIDTVNVTLSFVKWFNGKGLLRDVEMKGIRGVVDRTHVQTPTEYIDPRTYKHEHNTGDFELESFKMEDLLVTIYQPNAFRPFSVSIFSCDLPQLRKQWLFYDFLSANNVSGSYDNSLFTIHPRQTHNYTGAQLSHATESGDVQWKKQSRLRIDALNIDHLNCGVEGPFSWIHDGNVDIVADIMLPDENISIAKVMSDFYDRMEATVTSASGRNASMAGSELIEETEAVGDTTLSTETSGNRPAVARANTSQLSLSPNESSRDRSNADERFLIMDLRIHLNDVHASVPLFTKDISYINNALIRPIVAYINSKRSFIPINCRVVKGVDEFDGSWTIYDSGLLEDLSKEASGPASFRRRAKANPTTGLRRIRARCA